MPHSAAAMVSAQSYTCAITSIERGGPYDGGALKFRAEYGYGPDYLGTMHITTTLSGREVEMLTRQEDPRVIIGWPSQEVRDTIMPRVTELALLYNALRNERRRNG